MATSHYTTRGFKMDQELYYLITSEGIEFYSGDEIIVDVQVGGSLYERFDMHSESDVNGVVDTVFAHVTSRDYAKGEHVKVDAHRKSDGNTALYERETA